MSLLCIGKITKASGIKGEVKVYSESDFVSERFKKNQILYLKKNDITYPVTVVRSRVLDKVVTVLFKEFDTRNQAEGLRDFEVYIDLSFVSSLKSDEYYYFQLKGLKVIDQHDQSCGEVIEVMEQPASAILRIQDEHEVFLVPFVSAFVKEVNLQEGFLKIEMMDGLK